MMFVGEPLPLNGSAGYRRLPTRHAARRSIARLPHLRKNPDCGVVVFALGISDYQIHLQHLIGRALPQHRDGSAISTFRDERFAHPIQRGDRLRIGFQDSVEFVNGRVELVTWLSAAPSVMCMFG